MNTHPIDRAISGGTTAPLSNEQKKQLCVLAASAWQKAGRPYASEPMVPPEARLSDAEACELWRHERQEQAVGKRHLTSCTQADYPMLMEAFLRLLGNERSADAWAARALTDGLRRARNVLDRTCGRVLDVIDRPTAYAASIALAKYKTDLYELNERQTWAIVFDLRRAAAARRKKGVRA